MGLLRVTGAFAAIVALFDGVTTTNAFFVGDARRPSRTTTYKPIRQQQQQKDTKSVLFAKGWKQGPPEKLVSQTETIYVSADGGDAWKTMDAASLLNQGGMGVIPTETGYCFVTKVENNRNGVERLLRIKGMHTCKKPLAILAADLATIDKYCYGINKNLFKVLKRNLPGPCTFILPACTNTVPKAIFFDAKGGKHSYAGSTIRIRMPNDPVLRYLQDDLMDGESLLVSSLPVDEEAETQLLNCSLDPDAQWCNAVDFIVDAGERPYDGAAIFDATQIGEPELVREGIGELELV